MTQITRTERTTGVTNPQVAYKGLADNPQLYSWSPVTMLAYVKPASLTKSACLIDRAQSSSQEGIRFILGSANKNIWFSVRSSVGNWPSKFSSIDTIAPGEWQHVAATWSGSHLASGINLFHAGDGEQLALTGLYSDDDGTATGLYPANEDGIRGLRLFESSSTSTDYPFDGDVAYLAVWKAELTLAELRAAQENGPLAVRPDDLVFLRANGVDLSGYNAAISVEPSFTDGDLPPNLALDGSTLPLQVAGLTFASSAPSVELPGGPVVPLAVDGLTFPTSSGTVALPAGFNIQIYDDFERSSINAALSTVSTDTDGKPLITLQQRLQTVNSMGTNRWMEPFAKVTGVLGLNPRFQIVPYAGGSGDNRNQQTWRAPMRGHYSYDGLTWYVMPYISMTEKLTWRAEGNFTQDTVYVARSWPRSVTQIGNQIAALAAAHPTKISPVPSAQSFTPSLTAGFPAQAFIADEIGAKTDELGRPVPATPFYGFVIDDQAYGEKQKTAVITAGIHSGEDLGELILWEMIDVLLGDTAEAVAVRQKTRILIYPLMNPAGRYAGYWRGAPGSNVDPNSEWLTSTPTHDCVSKGKAVILADTAGRTPTAWGFEIHSTPYGGGPINLSINTDDAPTVEFDSIVRTRYPAGGWADYYDRTGASGDPATSATIRGFHRRDLDTTLAMLFESSDAYGPVSPTVMRPYAEAAIGAIADMQADGWFGEDENFASAEITESDDTGVATGTASISAELSQYEDNDTSAATSTVSIAAECLLQEGDDTLLSATAAGLSLNITEENDALACAGAIAISGNAEPTEADDTFDSAGAVSISGAVEITESDDALYASTSSQLPGIEAELLTAEENDAVVAEANVAIAAEAIITEEDALLSEVSVLISGVATLTEGDDTLYADSVQPLPESPPLPVYGSGLSVEELTSKWEFVELMHQICEKELGIVIEDMSDHELLELGRLVLGLIEKENM